MGAVPAIKKLRADRSSGALQAQVAPRRHGRPEINGLPVRGEKEAGLEFDYQPDLVQIEPAALAVHGDLFGGLAPPVDVVLTFMA